MRLHCIVQDRIVHSKVQDAVPKNFARVQTRLFRRHGAAFTGGDPRGSRAPVPGTGLPFCQYAALDQVSGCRRGPAWESLTDRLYGHVRRKHSLDLRYKHVPMPTHRRPNSMSPGSRLHRLLRRTDPSCRQWPMPWGPPSPSALTAATRAGPTCLVTDANADAVIPGLACSPRGQCPLPLAGIRASLSPGRGFFASLQ